MATTDESPSMQDQERFERLGSNLQQATELRQQIEELARRLERLDRDTARLLAGFVVPAYRDWQPRPGATAFYVDPLEGIYFQVVVVEVRGTYVRTRAASPHHTAYYSVMLDHPADQYERSGCIVPPALFDLLRDRLPLRVAPFV
ncbi:hypothetical protein [uncultured Lamprocystis sp.]|uniref:hypothetical protein n=1 Tax=uncultured Lamprocystis sp. TaxID=543132 RepID=UPI0025EB60C7|nr:hypothetical protein [uncultured Lamprocystis sp.]